MYCKRAQKEHAFRVQNMEAMSCYHYASEMVGMKLEKLVGKVVHARYRKASLDGYQEFYEAKVKRLNGDGTLKLKFKHLRFSCNICATEVSLRLSLSKKTFL